MMSKLRMHKPDIKMSKPMLTTRTTSTERTRGSVWMATRERILMRDMGICCCAECKALDRLLPAHEVDHVVPLEKGGSDDDSNLSAINADCHKRKSQREAQARAMRAVRPWP